MCEAACVTLGYCAEAPRVKQEIIQLDGIAALASHLRSDSFALVQAAAATLALCVQVPEARETLIEAEDGVAAVAEMLLHPEEPSLVANAALILGMLSEQPGFRADVHRHSGTDRLLAVLGEDVGPDVLSRACLALHYVTQDEAAAGHARRNGAVPLLVELLARPETEVHKTAALAVSSIAAHDVPAQKGASTGVRSDHWDLIGSFCICLSLCLSGCVYAEFASTLAITHLIHLMGSDDPEVQSAAAHALGSLGADSRNKVRVFIWSSFSARLCRSRPCLSVCLSSSPIGLTPCSFVCA